MKDVLKILTIGSVGVGKTSLINTYIEDSYTPNESSTVAPSTIEKNKIKSNGDHVKLNIWDTAGQERFQNMCHHFYRDADVALICFDEKNKNSIDLWALRVREFAEPTTRIILVATKMDTFGDDSHLQNSDKNESNPVADFREYCSRKSEELGNVPFFETSSLARMGLNELFDYISEMEFSLPKKEKTIDIKDQENNSNPEKDGCNC
ncbi:Ras-related protein RABG3b [Tritrichomonas foetus]|uniref:Ras-related protein RABG3b n=1 Tax=Tritrichomonas foetus TaxID=1144522 RepID=A0A1J4KQW1_9EUKA|nr:Ras-related protein RABG3b [Tritrichomonas foetus]|eukprot:OHT13482.1 Ras-related protein RABG3b [Tritrichomonas foetus]